MALYTTEDDHKRDDIIFYLLVAISEHGVNSFKKDRVHELLPFYLFLLRMFGIKDLGFYRDVVHGMYPELDKSFSAWIGLHCLESSDGRRYRLSTSPRVVKQLKESVRLNSEEKNAAEKAATLIAALYYSYLNFDDVMEETNYYFHPRLSTSV